ncbi:MAG: hypothetical protein KZQ76_01180 [Candidatus Thiodiazotropha sp. (ex Epidulcina cf. delphinae)]|nr:hypothetical protein [Candidatus Thiodiazotropha sp. (ex Epidulcina cf. delphinae)]
MLHLINKRSPGITSALSSIFAEDRLFHLVHLVLYFENPRFEFGAALYDGAGIYLSQIAFVRSSEVFSGKLDETFDAWVLGEGFKDAIDLDSFILPFWVMDKEYFTQRGFPGGEVYKSTFFSLPNDMKLCFEPNALNFKDRPSKVLFSSIGSNVLWNDRKTFSEWFIRNGMMGHVLRLNAKDK